jgi:hypothetical protein
MARKRQRIQAQGIHHRQLQQLQAGRGGLQMRQVERDEIVPKHERRPLGQRIQSRQGFIQVTLGERDSLPAILTHPGEMMDAPILAPEFEFDSETVGSEVAACGVLWHGGYGVPDAGSSVVVIQRITCRRRNLKAIPFLLFPLNLGEPTARP